MLQQGDQNGLQLVYSVLKQFTLGVLKMCVRLTAHIKAKGSDLMVKRSKDPEDNGALFIFLRAFVIFKSAY